MTTAGSIGSPVARALLALAMTAGSVAAHAPRAQSEAGGLLARPANLQVGHISLQRALQELTRLSGVPLAYSPSMLPGRRKVSCRCARVSVATALDSLLHGTGFAYREADGQVMLVPGPPGSLPAAGADPPLPGTAALGALSATLLGADGAQPPFITQPALVHAATIAGSVTSEGGGPVAGALVTSLRSRLSATTDATGRFRIVVPVGRIAAGPDALRLERIGYGSTDVPFELHNGDIRVDAVLPLQAVALDQVVVTGTAGNQERRAQAAVIGTIDAAEVVRQSPIQNVTQMLQARLPGINITESSGTTGAAARIHIRGASSISLSNQPLVFLDGVRIDGGTRGLVNVSGALTVGQAPSALNDLNPGDIESIEVVKGPAAATLYGADASAGVIQIITKRGRMGSRSFAQEFTFEYDHIMPNFEVPSNWARCTAALIAPTSPNPLCRGQDTGTLVSDNPAGRIHAFRNGRLGSFRYTARGGGESYGYFASFGIADERGTTLNDRLEQRSGRVNFTFAPTPRLTFDAGMGLVRTENELPRSDQDAYGYYIQSILGSPLTVRDDASDGSIRGGMLFASTSLESLSSIISRVSALRVTPSVQVRFAPVPWFSNRITLGADITEGTGFQLFPRNDQGWYPDRLPAGNGDVESTQEADRSYTVDYLGNVHAEWPSARLASDLSFGSQFIQRVSSRLSGAGAGLATNTAYLVTNAAVSTVGQGFGESRSHGLFVQEQIGWRDRLFLQFGLRADRNSAFGSEVGTFHLPKFGASWVVSEEPFWDGLSAVVPTVRLRAAWGTTGRSPSSGASLETWSTAKFVNENGQLELGIVPGNPGNADLKPERGKELELGFDAALLNDRLGIEFTWFDKTTTDLLVSVPVSPSSGFGASPLGNIGEVVNRGAELMLHATPVSRRNLVWDVRLNASTLHNEVTGLGTAGTFIHNFRAFVPGRQIAAWWVHRIREVDEAAHRVIVSDTAEFSGNQLPTFHASLATTLTLWRNLRVYAQLERKSGYHVLNLNQEFRDRSARSSASVNLPAGQGGYDTVDRLRRLGPYISERTGLPVGVANVKEPYVQKGDHFRLRELTATLALPMSLVRRIGASAAALTVGGRNLGLWAADFEGHDPEVLGFGPHPTGLNQIFNSDVFTTPPSRRWIVRLNVQY